MATGLRQDIESAISFRDRERMRDEITDFDPAFGEEPEELRHVPPLRPADVADRVIEAPLLVLTVVSAGPI